MASMEINQKRRELLNVITELIPFLNEKEISIIALTVQQILNEIEKNGSTFTGGDN